MLRPVPHDRLSGLLGEERGLTAAEAIARRVRYGHNDIVETPPRRWLDLVRDTARDPMLWFLVGVSGLFFLLGEYVEAAILLAALVPLVAMDGYLHRRTQASTEGLAGRLAARARAVRGETIVDIPARDLVPGDLAIIGSGDSFPADGMILSGAELQVDESALTGESYPVRKAPLPATLTSHPAVEDRYWASAGTRLLTGEARLRIAFTGGETLYGEIVRSAVAGSHARTPLQTAVAGLVAVILITALVICVALAAIRLHQGYGWIDALVSALTLAIAALPEEFPVVLAFFLGFGVYRLARRQALVRRAVAVENIGRVTCICSDKTGTLTEGRLTLAHQVPAEGMSSDALIQLAALAARGDSGDPLDDALLQAAAPVSTAGRLAVFPFTEDRRRESAIWRMDDGSCRAVVKGAPETVIGMCAIDIGEAERWRGQINGFAMTGHKVIACAKRAVDEAAWPGGEPDKNYTFAGLLAFEDRVREGVAEAVATCRAAGIRVIMVTGDHPVTAEAVGREIGLGGGSPVVVNAAEMAADTDGAILGSADVIARAAPMQKLELIRALQSQGEIVAVTGDGVNDVPALQAADIGIAMGERGTRSAREVAAIVLLDDNFRTIVRAIAEGRQLFLNLQLSFAYLLMVHIPLVLSAALIPLLGYPLLYLPIHIVWLELIIHPTALLVFQDLPVSRGLLPVERNGPPRFFPRRAWPLMGFVGATVTAVVVLGYDYALTDIRSVEHARAMALSGLIVAGATITLVLGGLRSPAARLIVAGSLASLGLLVQVPALSVLVHLRPLHLTDWSIVVAGGVATGLAALLVRWALKTTSRRPRPAIAARIS